MCWHDHLAHTLALSLDICFYPVNPLVDVSSFSLRTPLHHLPQALESLVTFTDESDPDFEGKELMREIRAKSEMGHWKTATRKLKKLTRRVQRDEPVPAEILEVVLEACMENRLQGARAAEPARKILEQMVEFKYPIPEAAGNYCIKNCLGESGPHSMHQGFAGIDTALAMLAALEKAETNVQLDTYDKICVALVKEGSITEALAILHRMVVDMSEVPPLATFAVIAEAAVADPKAGLDEKIIEVLTLAKAAGFGLDTIAKMQDGRAILAAGVVAAERIDNLNLGLRLLTAARSVENGDKLVSSYSRAAQRASTLIHKQAINKAVVDEQWKLAVKLMELMLSRGLRPSGWVWRNVVTCCAKAEKSRKSTALLMDWTNMYERKKADQPPLSVFNTVVNVCEICEEHELTLLVLDSMQKTHKTDGNVITFNIALKRLAKLGNSMACEGIIIGMLQAGIEPTVVSYTTAVASCVSNTDAKEPKVAYEWLKRMRSRLVNPNVFTYNTAMAACLDGTLESTLLGSKIAGEMAADLAIQLTDLKQFEECTVVEYKEGLVQSGKPPKCEAFDEYHTVIPDNSSKSVSRKLLQQLDEAIERGEMDARVAAATVRKPLLEISDFDASGQAAKTKEIKDRSKKMDEDEVSYTTRDEIALESASMAHRTAEV
jgi:hypothetical protein